MLRNASINLRRFVSSRVSYSIRTVGPHSSRTRCAPASVVQCKRCLSRSKFTRHIANHAKIDRCTAEPTIYALSTAAGRAGIAIIRISGPAYLDIYRGLCPQKKPPRPRFANVRTLYHPDSNQNVLDSDTIVLHFPSPKTVTGEDVLELHIHGGSATVKAVLAAIPKTQSTHTIRYAEPGEFTRRAFQNNRLDLAQVEALSDTLSAETEQQRRAAVRGSSGKLGRTYEAWREELLYARGELEALIDFSEDQYFDESPSELLRNVRTQVETILSSIAEHKSASHRGELLKRGIRISLLGAPNAGKSSLLNQIVGREASIVSQEAGTTRDIVEVSLDIRGYLCTFADTAGLRGSKSETSMPVDVVGPVEQEGIRRAKAKAKESDIVIAMASIEASDDNDLRIRCDEEALRLASAAARSMIVVNKCDLVPSSQLKELLVSFWQSHQLRGHEATPIVPVSCVQATFDTSDGGNIEDLITKLVGVFENMTSLPTDLEDLFGVTERQRQLLVACSASLQDFIDEATGTISGDDADVVIAAEHLRSAANCLARITGRGEAGDVEEVLGVVFEKFCVGK